MSKPLILDYKTTRQEHGDSVAYEYDHEASLNMITVNGIRQKFIETKNSDIQLETKTKIHQEQDDDNYLFELTTKTFTKVERDDEKVSLLEMETKTLKTLERDDEHFNNYK